MNIPQPGGSVARYPQRELEDAFLAGLRGEAHPVKDAARSSSEALWRKSFFTAVMPSVEEIEDLSEQD